MGWSVSSWVAGLGLAVGGSVVLGLLLHSVPLDCIWLTIANRNSTRGDWRGARFWLLVSLRNLLPAVLNDGAALGRILERTGDYEKVKDLAKCMTEIRSHFPKESRRTFRQVAAELTLPLGWMSRSVLRKLGAEQRFRQAERFVRERLACKLRVCSAILRDLASYADNMNDPEEAATLRSFPLRLSTVLLGDEHPNTLALISVQCIQMAKIGRYDDALEKALWTAETLERSEGIEPDIVFDAWASVSEICELAGRAQEGEPYMHRAVEFARKNTRACGEDSLARFLNGLGTNFSEQGRHREAAACYRESLDLVEKSQGVQSQSYLVTLNNLAGAEGELGHHDKREECLLECLALTESSMGPDDADTLMVHNNLSSLYINMGHFEKAEHHASLVWRKRCRLLGDEHPKTLSVRHNHLMALSLLGRHEEALVGWVNLMGVSSRIYGRRHPKDLSTRAEYARSLARVGRLAEAISILESVARERIEVIGAEHPHTLENQWCLAAACADHGDLERARSLFQKTLEAVERTLGTEHPEYGRCLFGLGGIALKQSQKEKATDLLAKAASILEKTVPIHPDTAVCRAFLEGKAETHLVT